MTSFVLLEDTTIQPVAATPTFSPVAGGYVTPVSVTISDATPASTIYYTVDGTTPTTASPVYSAPIVLPVGTTTVRAIATATGFTASAVGVSAYAISAGAPPPPPPVPAATPQFSPAAGNYAPPLTIILFDLTPGATIYYTTDGSIPTIASTVYTAPITLPVGTTTVNAIANAPSFIPSGVASATYVVTTPITPPPPPPPGTAIRVQATQACFYRGDYKDAGDVFDIFDPGDFSDSTQSQVPVGNPDYPLYGCMTIVPSTTPLFSWASSGLSSPRTSPRRLVE